MHTQWQPSRVLTPRLGRRLRQILGWCVHFYTALGLVCAAGIVLLIFEGTPAAFRAAFFLMLAATVIDATDGTLARAVRIKEALPGFDGRRLDDLTDFLTYTFLPLLLLWRAGVLPQGQEAWLLAPLLASAYGFCQVSAKTADGYFLGFPSYWNVVALCLYLLHRYVVPLPPWFSVGVLVGLSVLTFVPARYLYPTQKGRLNYVTSLLGAAWAALVVWVLYRIPVKPADGSLQADALTRGLIVAVLAYPVYYLVASWVVSVRLWWGRRPRGRPNGRTT
jgi:phosphatidylcholine synthase